MKKLLVGIVVTLLLFGSFFSAGAQEEHSALYYNMEGIKYSKQEDYDRAINSFMRAIQVDPNYVHAYVNLAKIYKKRQDYEAAISYLEKAREVEPNCVDIYINLSDIYRQQGNFAKAKECADKAVELTQDTPETIYNLGYAYLLNGERELALAQHQKLIEIGEKELAARLMEKIETGKDKQ